MMKSISFKNLTFLINLCLVSFKMLFIEIEDFVGLKVPKCEIFHLFDFNYFYGIKSL